MGTELGIDEAGRGSILGPLVMAGVLVEKSDEEMLKSWGVADSKLFGSQKKGKALRRQLAQKICEHCQHEILNLSSQKVDFFVQNFSLNILEQQTALKIVSRLPANGVILDGETLFSPILNSYVQGVDRADRSYVSVAAASILAKDKRDSMFEELCQEYKKEFGEIKGGGYANKNTLEFVKWFQATKGSLPPFYRRSYRWKYLDQA
jgi:ribonuclease HII